MGRKKSRPIRSGGIVSETSVLKENDNDSKELDVNNRQEQPDSREPVFIYVDCVQCACDEHLDIAQVVLNNVKFPAGETDLRLIEDSFRKSNFSLRFRLCTTEEGNFRMGHWPLFPADSIFLEFLVLENCISKDSMRNNVLFSGIFDGPDEGISGLAHLVSLKYLTVRLVLEVGNIPSFMVRVEILRSAFDACDSLFETVRQPWRKSMINAMSWLRPEVMTSEAIYGIGGPDAQLEAAAGVGSEKNAQFDAASFYEAIRPSRDEPVLDCELPDLLPRLRPYQRRAAYWMVQREKGVVTNSSEKIPHKLSSPFCVPVGFLESHSKMFYNPFNGGISLHPESSSSYVSGGILADEMGLGKTVELLACMFAHRKTVAEDGFISDDETRDIGSQIKRRKVERVECVCGAASESLKYAGLWVQCDYCDAWQHADCVGYSPKKKRLASHEIGIKRGSESVSSYRKKKRDRANIIEMDGNYICSLCSELIEAAKTRINTGATLIVCPAPILAQWHSEIIRHTRSGSLKLCIYEGARNLDSSPILRTDISELATADVVLTTYDVLKEDLSHDSDRHDGDRHFLRFQKRYKCQVHFAPLQPGLDIPTNDHIVQSIFFSLDQSSGHLKYKKPSGDT